jgi:hypothetical protein
MRRLFRSITCIALLALVMVGCGSTSGSEDGDSRSVLRFIRFDDSGITQADAVLNDNAQVDVEQNLCETSGGSSGGTPMVSAEPFTETVTNVILRNDQKLDIRLEHYVIHIADPNVGIGDLDFSMNGTVVGGRCSNVSTRSCASNQECAVGTTSGTCVFTETTLGGLLLVDFDTKDRVQPRALRRGLPVTITFFGSDVVGNDYRVTAGITITFDNFCNCGEGELCVS